MQRVNKEVKEFFKPTARCYKGLTILCFIWSFALFLICALVPTLINTYLDKAVPDPTIER